GVCCAVRRASLNIGAWHKSVANCIISLYSRRTCATVAPVPCPATDTFSLPRLSGRQGLGLILRSDGRALSAPLLLASLAVPLTLGVHGEYSTARIGYVAGADGL